MNKELNPLFTPWKIGNVEIKNRIVLTSMGGTSIFGWMEPHHFDKEAANFLLERARNNTGLILPGLAPIRNMLGGGWLYKSRKSFRDLKDFMEEFHKTGAKLFVQLTAGFGRSFAVNSIMEILAQNRVLGAAAKPVFDIDRLTASASPHPNRWTDKAPSRSLTVKEIEDMIYGLLRQRGCAGKQVLTVLKSTLYTKDISLTSLQQSTQTREPINTAVHLKTGIASPLKLLRQ
jgi:2-enoate reductase